MSDSSARWELAYVQVNIGGSADDPTGGYIQLTRMDHFASFNNLGEAWDRIRALAAEGWEPFAVTHSKEGWTDWHFRRQVSG